MKILAAAAAIIFFAIGAMAQTTNDLSDAEIQGRALAQKILAQQTAENFTNTGVLQIRGKSGISTNFEISCKTIVLSNGWQNIFEIVITNLATDDAHYVTGCFWKFSLFVNHIQNQTNSYEGDLVFVNTNSPTKKTFEVPSLKIDGLFKSFAHSDFSFADLGLEFFHWPEQKILKHEMRRSRECEVLESTNPAPSTNGYSRVVSWIDEETLGIVHAEAYDAQNKLLKEFDPKSFKKVNGQWELQEMEIRNVQTGSRSRIEFDLNKG